MSFRSVLAAVSALALLAAPTAASAQAAASQPAELAPRSEQVEGSEIRGGFILPLLALIALLVAVLKLTGDETPDSP